jgi:hypothetical protein
MPTGKRDVRINLQVFASGRKEDKQRETQEVNKKKRELGRSWIPFFLLFMRDASNPIAISLPISTAFPHPSPSHIHLHFSIPISFRSASPPRAC